VRVVLDTGASPNLVREDILPKDWERWRVPNIPLPRITNASGKQILAKAIVLYVQLGTTVHRVRFYVAPGMAVPCILGCNFINLHVKAILTKENKVDLHDGASVSIANESDSAYKAPPGEPATLASTEVRAAQRVFIPPSCEAHIPVQTAASELCLNQNRIRARPGHGPSLADGIAECNAIFPSRVVNFSRNRPFEISTPTFYSWSNNTIHPRKHISKLPPCTDLSPPP
jgi:Retroviral aspartyl protease